MVHNKLVQSSATQVVSMLSSGEVTSLTVREALDRQREKVDPEINAFDSIVSQESQANAGPLCGLPVTVKDQIAVAGHFRNFGLDEPARSLCTTTASVVRRFLNAGAVLSAKTNLPPYAMDFQTRNTRAGRTNNPWDTNRTSGGSSGGGAAAVAAGMSFLDILGSQ